MLQEYFWTSGISIIDSANLHYSNIHLHSGSGHCSCLVNHLIITVVLIGFSHLLINTNELFSVLTSGKPGWGWGVLGVPNPPEIPKF